MFFGILLYSSSLLLGFGISVGFEIIERHMNIESLATNWPRFSNALILLFFCRSNKTDKNMEKDVDTKAPAAVIDTRNVALPIVVKIESPKEAEKQKSDDDVNKPSKSRLCQLLPVLLFLVTFATVLTILIIYMDPSSE